MALIFLRDISSVTRTDLKPYCFEIATKDKTYYVACKSDNELYSWMDEIYNVCSSNFVAVAKRETIISYLFFSSNSDPRSAHPDQLISGTKYTLALIQTRAPL